MSAGAFSLPRGRDLDMRHRLPDLSAWRQRFSRSTPDRLPRGFYAPVRISSDNPIQQFSRRLGKDKIAKLKMPDRSAAHTPAPGHCALFLAETKPGHPFPAVSVPRHMPRKP